MEFRVLGPLEVHESARPLSLGSGRRLRSLLALFLARPNQILSSDLLIESLWAEVPPPSAVTGLRVHLTRLRTRLEPDRPRGEPSSRLVTEPPGYRLCVRRDELDSLRFEELVLLARRAESPALAASAYAGADLLWRGAAFADVDDLDPVRAEAVRLQELRADVLEESFDVRLALGEHAVLVPPLQHAIERYPLRERLAGQLMLALYRSGRQSEALRAYSLLRERLAESLGIEPDVALSRLETAIIRHEPELDLGVHRPEPRTTTVLVTGEAIAAIAAGSGGIRIERDENDDEAAFSFGSAPEALRCAAEVLGTALGATIGMTVGDSPHAMVREAAALRRAASPGSVVASETAALMAGMHAELQFEPARPATIDDGGTTMTAVGRLASAVAPESPAPLPGLLFEDDDFWFAGRGAELELVDGLRRAVEAGAFRVLLFSGEPGIGKTRLAAEAARRVHARGWTVLYGRCDEGIRTPFQPFVNVLEHFVSCTPDDALAERLGPRAGELARVLPTLSARDLDLEPPLHSEPETERYQFFQAVADWLRMSTRRRPTMLILDDLQWAAPPTLLLLRHLVRASDLDGLFLLATYRDTKPDRGETLDEMLGDLSLARRVDRFQLEGLDERAVYELLAHAGNVTGSAATEELAGLMHAETDGNPFFIHELIRHLAEPDPSVPRSDRSAISGAVPPSVRDVVARRLARLQPEVEDLLTAAAVIGREFDVALVSAVNDTDEDNTLYLLDVALDARLVRETGFDEYRFAHALVQSALYQALTETRRVRLHRRVGETLEGLPDERRARRLQELAHHFLEAAPAGDVDKGVQYAMQASDAALHSLAFEDAATFCRRAIAIARMTEETLDPEVECDLVFRLGRAEMRAGQPGARATLMRAFGMARELRDSARMAEAVLTSNRGFFSQVGRTNHDLVAALEDAISAQPDSDGDVPARLLAALVSEIVWSDDGERRFRLSDDALAMARRIGDRRTIANVLHLRGMTISAPGNLAQRVAGMRRAPGDQRRAA